MYPEEKIAQFVCRFEHSVAACMAHAFHARREPHDSSCSPSSTIVCGESVIKRIHRKLAKSPAFSLDPAHGLLHSWTIESALGDSSERFVYSTEKR